MADLLPKTAQFFASHLKNIKIIQNLVSSVNLRVEAEEAYERALNKSLQKVNEVETDHPLYSKMINSFKGMSSEKIHQVKHFKDQIANQSDLLKKSVDSIGLQMTNELNDVKNLEKELRRVFEKVLKDKSQNEQRIKELDDKLVLNEMSMLYRGNKASRKISQAILNQQKELLNGFKTSAEQFRKEIKHFDQLTLEKEKKISQCDIRIEEEFVDFIKKFNVHEISLIRNIQYDIDNMLKKTDIFNWHNTTEFKQKVSFKQFQAWDLQLENPYQHFKQEIMQTSEVLSQKLPIAVSQDALANFKKKLEAPGQMEETLQQIFDNFERCRPYIFEFIESYRKNHQFKFEGQNFRQMTEIFRRFLRQFYLKSDLEGINKILIFGNSYYHPQHPQTNRKRSIFEELKGEKFLSQLGFWRFYLYFSVRQAIIGCLHHEQDREIHMKSGVYSTLLSNSLTMIECEIEKHNVKNLIGKMAKTYGGLTEMQLTELFKVVESGFESYQKTKKAQAEEKGKTKK